MFAAHARQYNVINHDVCRAKGALQILKYDVRHEEQRQQFRLALTILAPEKVAQGVHAGMGRAVADRLDLNSTRTSKAWAESIEALVSASTKPMHSEHKMLQSSALVIWLCVVMVKAGYLHSRRTNPARLRLIWGTPNIFQSFSLLEMARRNEVCVPTCPICVPDPGCAARLHHLPISFAPAQRKVRKDSVSEATKEKVGAHYEKHCATSPSAKDQVRKRLGPLSYITAPLLVLLTSIGRLFKGFCEVS